MLLATKDDRYFDWWWEEWVEVKNVNIIIPCNLEIIIMRILIDSLAELMLFWTVVLFTRNFGVFFFWRDEKITTFNGCPSIKYESLLFPFLNLVYLFLGNWVYEKYFTPFSSSSFILFLMRRFLCRWPILTTLDSLYLFFEFKFNFLFVFNTNQKVLLLVFFTLWHVHNKDHIILEIKSSESRGLIIIFISL